MIVSHRHRFIFVKTHKTSGSSLEVALSKHCGPDDILTPMLAEEEAIRARPGYRGPQNHLLPWGEHRPKDFLWELANRRRRVRFYNHLAAKHIRRHVDEDVWQSYFKFTIERNPWDKVRSAFDFHRVGSSGKVFERWVVKGKAACFSDWHLYADGDALLVDHICRHENLADDMRALGERLGLPEPLELPHAKKGAGGERRHRSEIYTEAMRERIARDFAREIACMGYEF